MRRVGSGPQHLRTSVPTATRQGRLTLTLSIFHFEHSKGNSWVIKACQAARPAATVPPLARARPMASRTVEDYIKQIYQEQQPAPGQLVSLGRLATAMEVVPGTVTTMVKALAEAGLVSYEPRQGVRLTPAGEKLALHVLRRHRLIELFLVQVLKFDWSEVHAEAEELEHAVSDRLLERIDELLGRPGFDPHGDPIPSAAGEVAQPRLHPLNAARPADRGVIARIADQQAEFLRYATARGLVPGAEVVIQSVDVPGDSITLLVRGKSRTLGRAAAAGILVAWQPETAASEL